MYSEIVQVPQFYLDEIGYYFPEATTFILTGKHLKYLYNIFNSSVFTFLFKRFYAGGGLGEKGYRYKKAFFEKLPIPLKENTSDYKIIEGADNLSNIENECLNLFNFTEEEKAFIESQCSL